MANTVPGKATVPSRPRWMLQLMFRVLELG
jgi:hypothetical protein